MKRAMASKLYSTSTLDDAEETLKAVSWANVGKMDKAAMRAEIQRLQETVCKCICVCMCMHACMCIYICIYIYIHIQ